MNCLGVEQEELFLFVLLIYRANQPLARNPGCMKNEFQLIFISAYGKNQKERTSKGIKNRGINVTCCNEGSPPIVLYARKTEKGEKIFSIFGYFRTLFSILCVCTSHVWGMTVFWIKKIHFWSHAAIIERGKKKLKYPLDTVSIFFFYFWFGCFSLQWQLPE